MSDPYFMFLLSGRFSGTQKEGHKSGKGRRSSNGMRFMSVAQVIFHCIAGA